jgi:hypothetical protein
MTGSYTATCCSEHQNFNIHITLAIKMLHPSDNILLLSTLLRHIVLPTVLLVLQLPTKSLSLNPDAGIRTTGMSGMVSSPDKLPPPPTAMRQSRFITAIRATHSIGNVAIKSQFVKGIISLAAKAVFVVVGAARIGDR